MDERPEDRQANPRTTKSVFAPSRRVVPKAKGIARDLKRVARGRLDRHSPQK
jgi:hypothetical protein